MTQENLICFFAGLPVGCVAFALWLGLRARLRERRLRHMPGNTILFRP